MSTWIWQQENWPHFTWDSAIIAPILRELHQKIGELVGKATVDGTPSAEQSVDTLLQNILASSEIENETLNAQSVRSSLAKRLHITTESPYPVSERLDRPTIHFIAPPHTVLELELQRFLDWFRQSQHDPRLDPLLRAGICHLWFVTLHPFEDGNGRITRALTDMALAQANPISIYLYAMSPQILAQRKDYYLQLENTQRGTVAITAWLCWFLQELQHSLQGAIKRIDRTIATTRFWQRHAQTPLLAAQIKVLNRLLEGGEKGFAQGVNATQYRRVAKVSKATATRHLTDLVAKGCLERLAEGGRSTRYQIA